MSCYSMLQLMEAPTVAKVDAILDKLHAFKIKGTLGAQLLDEVKADVTKEVLPAELETLLKSMLCCEKKVNAHFPHMVNFISKYWVKSGVT